MAADDAKQVIAGFWDAMGSNDFEYASKWLARDYEYYMPQTKEYFTGRANFVALNQTYPADGIWLFNVQSIVAEGDISVSDVEITDGSLKVRAVTFHTLIDGLIHRQKEYWPEEYEAPAWRKDFVQIVKSAPF